MNRLLAAALPAGRRLPQLLTSGNGRLLRASHFPAGARRIHASGGRFKVVPFHLADIGEGITECELIQWFIAEGADIQQFDKICEVQSDKATVEITSRFDGKVVKLHYKAGDVAKVGSALIDIETGEAGGSDEKASAAPEVAPAAKSATPAGPSAAVASGAAMPSSSTATFATPAVRRIAKEHGIDLAKVAPTGRGGRITKEDILVHVGEIEARPKAASAALAHAPGAAAAPFTPTAPTTVPLSPIQRAMVKSMNASLKIPHFGFADTMSLTALKALRADVNAYLGDKDMARKLEASGLPSKLSFMPFFIKSFSMALRDFPLLNAQFVDSATPPHVLYRPDHNVGIAVDTPNGLTVPAIHGAHAMSILEIGAALQSLADKAKKNQLPPSAFANTTITISNIGNIAGDNLHPVIPPDTVCIVAIGKSKQETRLVPDAATPRGYDVITEDFVTVSFSADHRVVDGATVARFFLAWKALVENPARMALWMK